MCNVIYVLVHNTFRVLKARKKWSLLAQFFLCLKGIYLQTQKLSKCNFCITEILIFAAQSSLVLYELLKANLFISSIAEDILQHTCLMYQISEFSTSSFVAVG